MRRFAVPGWTPQCPANGLKNLVLWVAEWRRPGHISRLRMSTYLDPIRVVLLAVVVWAPPVVAADQQGEAVRPISGALSVSAGASAGGDTDTWRGYKRHIFTVDGCTAWVVEPRVAAPGRPWTWCMEFPDAFTDRTGVPQLLERGFHHVYIKVGNTFGSPAALRHFDVFYRTLMERGFATKAVLIGISRGGLYAYNWAALNPDKVAVIYGDAPVGDFKSWPGGKGSGKGSPKDWTALLQHYGFRTEAEALAYGNNPIDTLAPLARAKIPLLHVVGDADDVVPFEENTAVIERRYRELGGHMIVIHKRDVGHHPHGLDDPAPVVSFILEHATIKAK